MALNKNDFIEIEFSATADGEIFDSNKKEDLTDQTPAKPFIYAIGSGMFLEGVDEFLIGKDEGSHTVELSAEKAFGRRDAKLIQMVPMKVFNEQQIRPVAGAMFNFDGRLAKILTVSGGRVMVDFNNPVAGKDVVYDIKILRKIEDINEKVKSLLEFFTKKDLPFEIKDKKLVVKCEKPYDQFLTMFKDKFKEILGLELEIKSGTPLGVPQSTKLGGKALPEKKSGDESPKDEPIVSDAQKEIQERAKKNVEETKEQLDDVSEVVNESKGNN